MLRGSAIWLENLCINKQVPIIQIRFSASVLRNCSDELRVHVCAKADERSMPYRLVEAAGHRAVSMAKQCSGNDKQRRAAPGDDVTGEDHDGGDVREGGAAGRAFCGFLS